MLHASTRKLIDRLSEMTELGKLDWTESEDGTLAYATEGYSVTLTESPNEVIITSKSGKELERATAEELASTPQDNGGAYTSIVAAMTMEASRIARGTEAAISSLLADLQDEPEPDPADRAAAEIDTDEDLVEDPINETTAFETEPVTPAEPDAGPELAAETVEETEPSRSHEVSSQDDPQSDAPEPETMDTPEMDPVETEFAAAESEPALISAPADIAETEATIEENTAPETETETETETESEVTEAVARLADEVNQRQDSGLDAAAASAVGAVALAAGITTQIEPEDKDAPASDADAAPVEIAAAEPDAVPTYIPFGLEAEAEEEVAIVAATNVTSEDTSASEIQESETQDASPEIGASAPFAFTPAAEPAATMWQSSEVAAEPETESEAEAETVAEVAAEPETRFEIAAEPTDEPVSDLHVSAPAFGGIMGDSANEPAPLTTATAEEAQQEIAAAAEVEETVAEEAAEAPTPEPEPEPEAAAPEPPKTYSLSGIGAGFGLGALSAKTEASGIPSARPSSGPAPEKVIIDATDDVLPELEGNLNVSLAETASAAVSAANAEPAAPEQAETPDASETDILKPRTRFNPWD
jgi:hypothetical protein